MPDSHCRLGSDLSRELVVVAFMTNMLILEHLSIHLDLISEIVRLIVDSWVVCVLLGSKVRGQNSEISAWFVMRALTCGPYRQVAS